MSLIRKGTAEWFGTGLEGNGELSSPSRVLNKTPYNLSNRFENENGSLPKGNEGKSGRNERIINSSWQR